MAKHDEKALVPAERAQAAKPRAGNVPDELDDGKRYWVTVADSVHVMGNMWLRPHQETQADGHMIRTLMEKPENEGRITLGNVVPEDQVR